MTTFLALAVSCSVLLPSAQDPHAKPTRSTASVLVRQHLDVAKTKVPVATSGDEMGTGKGPMVMLVRRADGALQVQEIERGADDKARAAEFPAETGEAPTIRVGRKGEQVTLGNDAKPEAVAGKELDRAACRTFLATLRPDKDEKNPSPALTFDVQADVTLQQLLTVWEIARELGWQNIEFKMPTFDVPKLADADRKLLAGFPKEYGWTIRTVQEQPLVFGEVLLLLEGDAKWRDVAPVVMELAMAGVWEFAFVCKKDATTFVKLPAHLPVNVG